MPIDIRGRLPFCGKRPTRDSEAGRYAAFFVPSPTRTTADAQVIIRAAREQQALGYDSSLIPTNSARPDVWACCGWALAATDRLHLVGALRMGWQQPTLAARTLATLSQLSGGRIHAHLLQGRSDEDMRRDGDRLPKAQRYERSEAFLQVFKRTLQSTTAFDFDSPYYRVKGAFSAVKPLPGLTLHMPGGSEAGQQLAARHADVWAVAGRSTAEVAQAIERMRQLAHAQRRTLGGFWAGGFNVILGETDEQAWAKATAITEEVRRHLHTQPSERRGPLQPSGDALYLGLSELTGHGPSLVGSPQTLAARVLEYYRAGVTCITLGGLCEYQSDDGSDLIGAHDRQLLAELIRQVRARVAAHDASLPPQSARSLE